MGKKYLEIFIVSYLLESENKLCTFDYFIESLTYVKVCSYGVFTKLVLAPKHSYNATYLVDMTCNMKIFPNSPKACVKIEVDDNRKNEISEIVALAKCIIEEKIGKRQTIFQ